MKTGARVMWVWPQCRLVTPILGGRLQRVQVLEYHLLENFVWIFVFEHMAVCIMLCACTCLVRVQRMVGVSVYVRNILYRSQCWVIIQEVIQTPLSVQIKLSYD